MNKFIVSVAVSICFFLSSLSLRAGDDGSQERLCLASIWTAEASYFDVHKEHTKEFSKLGVEKTVCEGFRIVVFIPEKSRYLVTLDSGKQLWLLDSSKMMIKLRPSS